MSAFYTPSELLVRAQAGDAVAAAELWRLIERGAVPDLIALAWLRDVARQVVAKVLDPDVPANRARERARAALGLEGRADGNLDLARWVAENPGTSAVELAQSADLVLDVGKATPGQVKRKIDYLRKKRE